MWLAKTDKLKDLSKGLSEFAREVVAPTYENEEDAFEEEAPADEDGHAKYGVDPSYLFCSCVSWWNGTFSPSMAHRPSMSMLHPPASDQHLILCACPYHRCTASATVHPPSSTLCTRVPNLRLVEIQGKATVQFFG